MAGPEAGRTRADPRLSGYLVAGFGALVAAIATGHPGFAALGAPFLVLAARGLVGPGRPLVRGSVHIGHDRVIEGDPVEGEVVLDWDGVAELDVVLADPRGVRPEDPPGLVGWTLPAGQGRVTLPFRLRAESWGVHELGALWVRARRPGRLLVWEEKVAAGPTLRVLPAPLRLDRLLEPAEPRAVSGMHVSRLRGHGTDFAEARPYRPGDRLRELSWSTSARMAEPWVTVRHPERTGTVLLLLDAFFSQERGSTEALARAARAAWAVAAVHLKAQDRVGLLARGRSAAWVPPHGGRRARWLLMDELLSVGAAAQDLDRRRRRGRRVLIPSDAFVVGITGLRSRAFMRDLLHLRRTGHATAALVIDLADLLPSLEGDAGAVSRRLWLARRDGERQRLEGGGVPTFLVRGRDGVGAAISAARRRMGGIRAARSGGRAR